MIKPDTRPLYQARVGLNSTAKPVGLTYGCPACGHPAVGRSCRVLRLLSGLLSAALLSGFLLPGGLLILLAGLVLLAGLLGLIWIVHLGYLTVEAEQPLK